MILGLGALQGAIGWWMVASGLADRVEVSQYRLAAHLVLACLIYAAVLWTASRWEDEGPSLSLAKATKTDRWILVRCGAVGLLVLVLLQIYLGALVAGLRAGYAYNTWPLIDGALVPQGARLFFDVPFWRNFFENPLTVQFDHRVSRLCDLVVRTISSVQCGKLTKASMIKAGPLLTGAAFLAMAVTVQAALGIWTLLAVVPLPLALMHQAMAMVTLTFAVIHAARVTPRYAPLTPRPVPGRDRR